MEKMIRSLDELDFKDRHVLVRLDINSPLEPSSKKIVDTNRIMRSIPTLKYLIAQGARIAIIAHQGDTLDYHNLIPLEEHAQILSQYLEREVRYVDDVCGDHARSCVRSLKSGELVLLGNLRYLCEEVSTFENAVTLTPKEMASTWLVRRLAPLFDLYVNDAFSAAHRNCPSQVAFQRLLPSAAGRIFFDEYTALRTLLNKPRRPSVFLLGGAKISDAFGMLESALECKIADTILTGGVIGHVFLMARGYRLGEKSERWLCDRSLTPYIEVAAHLLEKYGDHIVSPSDLAYEKQGERMEVILDDLPVDDALFLDVGHRSVEVYRQVIADASSLFINGPVGMYENPLFAFGTKELWKAAGESEGFSVMGGGDSVNAKRHFNVEGIDRICTAGGAMVHFMSGQKLPLINAMEESL